MVPPELRSTVELLRRSFPIPPRAGGKEYLAVLAFLSEHLSERQLGTTISLWVGCDDVVVRNDAAKSRSTERPTESELKTVMAKLQAGGLTEWLDEED